MPSPRWTSFAAIVVAVSAAAAIVGTHTGSQAAIAQDSGFELVGVHPQAVDQPTEIGKRLVSLFPWQGRLFPGYGDYTANTGPISISPYDPTTGKFEQVWVSDTEAIQNYRPIRGRLYAPATDPRSDADYAVGEPWADHEPLTVTHAYDMVTLDGSDLWIVGSKGYRAAAWRSVDNGATWTLEQSPPAVDGSGGDFARFYFAGVYLNRLYLQAYDYAGAAHPASKVFDGTRWSDGPDLLGSRGMGWRPETFAGRMVYMSWAMRGVLHSFDGGVVRHPLDMNLEDFSVDDGQLFALASRYGWTGSRVVRTADLITWHAMDVDVPDGARSLGVLGGRFYVGGDDARLHRLSSTPTWQPISVTWNADPVVRIVGPQPGERFVAPARILIEAEVTDPDGGALTATFWNGADVLGEVDGPPYRLTWTDVLSGTYEISVSTTDMHGDFANDTVSIRVSEDPWPTATTNATTATPTATETTGATPGTTPDSSRTPPATPDTTPVASPSIVAPVHRIYLPHTSG